MKRMCWTLGVYLHHKARIRCGLKCPVIEKYKLPPIQIFAKTAP